MNVKYANYWFNKPFDLPGWAPVSELNSMGLSSAESRLITRAPPPLDVPRLLSLRPSIGLERLSDCMLIPEPPLDDAPLLLLLEPDKFKKKSYWFLLFFLDPFRHIISLASLKRIVKFYIIIMKNFFFLMYLEWVGKIIINVCVYVY